MKTMLRWLELKLSRSDTSQVKVFLIIVAQILVLDKGHFRLINLNNLSSLQGKVWFTLVQYK